MNTEPSSAHRVAGGFLSRIVHIHGLGKNLGQRSAGYSKRVRINLNQPRIKATDLQWAAPPNREPAETPSAAIQDTVQLSVLDKVETGVRNNRGKLLLAMGYGMMAAGRLAGMVSGGPALAPSIICSSQVVPSQDGTRLEQVLSCEKASSAADLKQSIHKANFAWEGLRTHTGGGLEHMKDRPGASGGITNWPYGQVMAAALDQAKLSGDYKDFEKLVQGLDRYRHPDGGYASSRGPFGILGDRFYDDNAWLGLVFTQAAMQKPDAGYLQKAQEIASFLQAQQQPDGGILWQENNPNPSYNTCTFGPAIELSLRLYQMTGDQKQLDFARDLTRVMDSKLRLPNGLYADNMKTKTGDVDPTLWAYNQGTPVGAHLLWYEITGDESHLTQARQTATAALQHYGEDGLWKQPPAFVAVFLRNLMQLKDPAVDKALNAYLDRAWESALDQKTGIFDRQGHGMGSYEGEGHTSTIDQAALVQLLALRDWPVAERGNIT